MNFSKDLIGNHPVCASKNFSRNCSRNSFSKEVFEKTLGKFLKLKTFFEPSVEEPIDIFYEEILRASFPKLDFRDPEPVSASLCLLYKKAS